MAKAATIKKTTTKKAAVAAPVEEYMNPAHLSEFRGRLLQMQEDCLRSVKQANEAHAPDEHPSGDDADRSDQRMEIESRARNLERLAHTLREIEAALHRIEAGEFGYCEQTGDEIGLERLKANPLARLTIEAQERLERMGRLRAVV